MGRERGGEGKGRGREGKGKEEKKGEEGEFASVALGDRRPCVNKPYFFTRVTEFQRD